MTGLVDCWISGTECSAHKPAPDIYLKALESMGLKAEETFAVEDSPAGIEAALRAGMRVYALKPRHGERIDQSRGNCRDRTVEIGAQFDCRSEYPKKKRRAVKERRAVNHIETKRW